MYGETNELFDIMVKFKETSDKRCLVLSIINNLKLIAVSS